MIFKMGDIVLVGATSVAGWGTVIEGGTSRSVVGRKVGRHVVRIVCEHQQRGWLIRCVVVQGFVLVHRIWKVLQLNIVTRKR